MEGGRILMAAHQTARGGEKNGPFWLFDSVGKGREARNCMMGLYKPQGCLGPLEESGNKGSGDSGFWVLC